MTLLVKDAPVRAPAAVVRGMATPIRTIAPLPAIYDCGATGRRAWSLPEESRTIGSVATSWFGATDIVLMAVASATIQPRITAMGSLAFALAPG